MQNCYYNTPLFIGPMPLATTYRHVDMKALARYQLILLGEQRHIGVNNLPKVVARQYSGRKLNLLCQQVRYNKTRSTNLERLSTV